jgi:RimJ/RimL family protein N-acetyltransferase
MINQIMFLPLEEEHFSLLTHWLGLPHVAQWWGNGVEWTAQRVKEKYSTYVEGHAKHVGVSYPIHAFILFCNDLPIGFIQFYDQYDFSKDIGQSPGTMAGLDFYIGETTFLGKGLGVITINEFLRQHVWPHFKLCVVDPDPRNLRAIKVFARTGFLPLPESNLMQSSRKNDKKI